MESFEFEVNDMVEAYGQYIGWITYINYKKEEADIEFDYGNTELAAAVVPFKYLKKVENFYGNDYSSSF